MDPSSLAIVSTSAPSTRATWQAGLTIRFRAIYYVNDGLGDIYYTNDDFYEGGGLVGCKGEYEKRRFWVEK